MMMKTTISRRFSRWFIVRPNMGGIVFLMLMLMLMCNMLKLLELKPLIQPKSVAGSGTSDRESIEYKCLWVGVKISQPSPPPFYSRINMTLDSSSLSNIHKTSVGA